MKEEEEEEAAGRHGQGGEDAPFPQLLSSFLRHVFVAVPLFCSVHRAQGPDGNSAGAQPWRAGGPAAWRCGAARGGRPWRVPGLGLRCGAGFCAGLLPRGGGGVDCVIYACCVDFGALVVVGGGVSSPCGG